MAAAGARIPDPRLRPLSDPEDQQQQQQAASNTWHQQQQVAAAEETTGAVAVTVVQPTVRQDEGRAAVTVVTAPDDPLAMDSNNEDQLVHNLSVSEFFVFS